ncbi:iron ABC transporter substrate-binding protein [Actinomadura sp. NBRC 104412]|uniref:iron ABC transporter substrate-binding protein n=1 Tax=Actinomadura sp. NBRC 104412 TaxID=3032203 RepID=UPI0024A01C90|nr:iron ABC transporter substrate-binding protein [Actinomadura sp. NBRC 104412]GLZ02738.1 iron ABC transporter substrate-binding protein [Actinomadura sp. NBRC 104412]
MRPRLALLALWALLTPLVLAACGGDGFDDDALVIYSGRNKNLVGPLLDDMERTTGLNVQVRYGDSAELAAQIQEEGDRTRADLFFSQDAGALGALTKAGRLQALPQPLLGRVPAEFRAKDGTWVGLSGRARVFAYDPRQVPRPPKSVFELTGPAWRGRVGWAPTNASFQAFVTGMRVTEGEARARQWLTAMKAAGTRSYDNNVLALEAVDRGEIALALINHYYWYEEVAEKGQAAVHARIAFVTGGDPGGLINVAGIGVLKGTERRAAAEKAVDFLLSRTAQAHFATETKEYPLVAGVPAERGLPPLDSLHGPDIDLSSLDSLERTLDLLKEVGLV